MTSPCKIYLNINISQSHIIRWRYTRKPVATAFWSLWGHLQLRDTYHSSVSNDSITYTHPDRKLGILRMKYFAGVGGVNGLLNEASQPEFIMKISDKWETPCDLTCRPSKDIYKDVCTHTLSLFLSVALLYSWGPIIYMHSLAPNTNLKVTIYMSAKEALFAWQRYQRDAPLLMQLTISPLDCKIRSASLFIWDRNDGFNHHNWMPIPKLIVILTPSLNPETDLVPTELSDLTVIAASHFS